jgi:hypothetical protein
MAPVVPGLGSATDRSRRSRNLEPFSSDFLRVVDRGGDLDDVAEKLDDGSRMKPVERQPAIIDSEHGEDP